MCARVPLVENAPAKVNLTLRVLGRRAEGYHEIESLVVFAGFGDRVSLLPGRDLGLSVSGPRAAQIDSGDDNLVLKAVRALAARVPGLGSGAFHLDKMLPVAAGLGGGSADAAAALRLLARVNGLRHGDVRLTAAACAAGADVAVCLDSRSRVMRGIGEVLSEPLALPPLDAVLVNPGVAVPTKAVFGRWTPPGALSAALEPAAIAKASGVDQLLQILIMQPNDLEAPAIALAPVIADVLAALRELPECRLARMSGSGSTCFALFASAETADAAAKILERNYPHWWVRAGTLGGRA
ncbi:MAG TPA: 4-(cytidine 5'-diphospho)-2-C-methyl-D-erythritol kinase [Xanthobacteraceae bacterium]